MKSLTRVVSDEKVTRAKLEKGSSAALGREWSGPSEVEMVCEGLPI